MAKNTKIEEYLATPENIRNYNVGVDLYLECTIEQPLKGKFVVNGNTPGNRMLLENELKKLLNVDPEKVKKQKQAIFNEQKEAAEKEAAEKEAAENEAAEKLAAEKEAAEAEKNKIETLEKTVEDQSKTIADLEQKLETAEKTVEDQSKTIADLEQKLSLSKDDVITVLEQKLKATEEELAAAKKLLADSKPKSKTK